MALDPTLLASFEHALVLLSWPPASQASTSTSSIHLLLEFLIVRSEYATILRSLIGKNILQWKGDDLSVSWSNEISPLERLVYAIAAIQAFLQTNWTGPEVELEPSELFGEGLDKDEVNVKAVQQLAIGGEPAYHLAKKAGFLLLARRILGLPIDDEDPEQSGKREEENELKSWKVWQLRLGVVNLRLLDTPIPLPGSLLDGVTDYLSSHSGTSSTLIDVRTSLTLLLGLYHSQFVHFSSSATKASSETFYSAAQTAKLQYELTGRLGKRTRWQIDEKTQLVVLAESRHREDGWKPREKMELKHRPLEKHEENVITPLPGTEKDQPTNLMLNDDTLLERTQYTSSSALDAGASVSPLANIDPNKQPVLHPLDQCILLALSLSITNTSPAHGLTTTQIQSFVSRILEDGSQNWSVYTMALLLRSRLEANRSRTVERGLLQMQSLVDQLKLESISKPQPENALDLEKGATPLERLQYFFNLNLPSTWELEKELATRYLGLGVTRSAMEIFTRLEMWEDVAKCYFSLGDEARAVQVVRDLLDGKLLETETTMAASRGDAKARELSPAQRAKLLCLLGDLTHDPSHYDEAWKVSGGTSSRAMRSLGQHFFTLGKYPLAQSCLEKALLINPLFVKVWFVLGCCAMRNEDWKAAERAFRRCTGLEDDDGESWNNLATVMLKQTSSGAAFAKLSEEEQTKTYELKRTAYTCLGQAIKHSYDSWRIWTNYLLVSVDIGELSEAIRAMSRLVELRGEKDGENSVDLDVLDRMVDVVVKEKTSSSSSTNGEEAANIQRGMSARVRSLFETAILPRITNSSRIYTSYARFLFSQNDFSGSLQAHLKAYRVDVVTNEDVTTSLEQFQLAAARVLETVDVLRNLGERDDGKGGVVMSDWRSQARSVMRSYLGRTKETFGEEPEWEKISEELKELRSGA